MTSILSHGGRPICDPNMRLTTLFFQLPAPTCHACNDVSDFTIHCILSQAEAGKSLKEKHLAYTVGFFFNLALRSVCTHLRDTVLFRSHFFASSIQRLRTLSYETSTVHSNEPWHASCECTRTSRLDPTSSRHSRSDAPRRCGILLWPSHVPDPAPAPFEPGTPCDKRKASRVCRSCCRPKRPTEPPQRHVRTCVHSSEFRLAITCASGSTGTEVMACRNVGSTSIASFQRHFKRFKSQTIFGHRFGNPRMRHCRF